jgi:hypothetical protein
VPDFKPITRKPGEIIKSDEWNKIQEDIRTDLEKIEKRLQELKEYVDNMVESVTLVNVDSPVGKSYLLNETVPGETMNYGTRVMGLISRQWLSEPPEAGGSICRFGLTDLVDSFSFWAGAEKGNAKLLDVNVEYVDGSATSIGGLYIHDCAKLSTKGKDNPYVEYLLSPNERIWYKYEIKNPNPDKEIRHISFIKTKPDSSPRIANVLHYRSRIKPLAR